MEINVKFTESQKKDTTAFVERCKGECTLGYKDQPWGYHGSNFLGHYRNHIQKSHKPGFSVDPEIKRFADWSEFDNWRLHTCLSENAQFGTLPTKPHTVGRARTFYCSRSGYYTPEGTGKRKIKSIQSYKINGLCPALIRAVREASGQVTVTFFRDHFGHTMESNAGRMVIPPVYKEEIVQQLKDEMGKAAVMRKWRLKGGGNPASVAYHVTSKVVSNVCDANKNNRRSSEDASRARGKRKAKPKTTGTSITTQLPATPSTSLQPADQATEQVVHLVKRRRIFLDD